MCLWRSSHFLSNLMQISVHHSLHRLSAIPAYLYPMHACMRDESLDGRNAAWLVRKWLCWLACLSYGGVPQLSVNSACPTVLQLAPFQLDFFSICTKFCVTIFLKSLCIPKTATSHLVHTFVCTRVVQILQCFFMDMLVSLNGHGPSIQLSVFDENHMSFYPLYGA